jgi:hypothetical protein
MQEANTQGIGRASPVRASWYLAYCGALLETDRKEAAIRIEYAEEIVLKRLVELRSSPAHSAQEIQDLNTALTHLAILHEQVDDPDDRLLWD